MIGMQFHEAATTLLELRRVGLRPGTDATAAFLDSLGNPHRNLSCVQIAGSNGKGSTARMLESILLEAGLSVGLYTSPHFDDFRERVRVDGRPIRKHAVTEFVSETNAYLLDQAADGDSPTFFETLTVLALWEFDRQDVDIAIIEVGIGGRYDATSVVDPLASAVTSVTLEHTELLGEDVETIAQDKAAVAPEDGSLVTGATGSALSAIRETTGDILTVGERADADMQVTYGGRDGLEGTVSMAGAVELESRVAMVGPHQARNAGVAVALATQVGEALDSEVISAVERGLRNAHWPGRFEVMETDPLVVLDGAHNPGGCEAVAETLSGFSFEKLHLVFGAMTDKDHRGMAEALSQADTVVACEPDHDRAEKNDVLARVFERESEATVSTRADVAGAFADTLERADSADCVLVTGSLYAVREARRRYSSRLLPKQVDSIPTADRLLANADVTDAGTWRMRGKAVHTVRQTRVQPRQAQYLKEEMLSLGGECAVSALSNQDEELVDIVLMGTLAQFKRLCEKLDGQPFGLSPFADELRTSLGMQTVTQTDGYPWDEQTCIMGILNVTPDSFHDGGEFNTHERALARAQEMVDAGADIIDIGGESTRPGADPVPIAEEKARVVSVIEALADIEVVVSVDTRRAEVARAALEAGADMINDVSGLRDPEMRHVAAEYDVPVVVMHSIETPVNPENETDYDDVVEDVIKSLSEQVLLAEKAGLDRSQIVIDPGIGFGKTATESFELLGRLGEFQALGCPILVGHSHKSMFEHVGYSAGERYEATVAATAVAASRAADIIRVHDIEGNVAAVDVVEAIANQR